MLWRVDSARRDPPKQAEKDTKGAVYNLNAFNGKVLAGVNNKVILYRWVSGMDEDSRELVSECSHAGHILALYVAVRGEFILVGDLMKSMSLLIYKPEARAGACVVLAATRGASALCAWRVRQPFCARLRQSRTVVVRAPRRRCRKGRLRSARATPTARG